MKRKVVFIPRDAQIHIFVTENIRNQLYVFDKDVVFVDAIQHF